MVGCNISLNVMPMPLATAAAEPITSVSFAIAYFQISAADLLGTFSPVLSKLWCGVGRPISFESSMTVSGISSIPFGGLSQEAPQTATQNAIVKLLNGSVASSLGSASLSLSRLGSAATSIVTNAINYEGNVALSVSGLPFGVN